MQYMGSPFQQTATVTNKLQLSPHVYEFTFQVPREMTFMPGQYATFIIDNQTRRQYSFASPCINPKEFEIVVDVTPMGPGSKFFLEKNVGDAIDDIRCFYCNRNRNRTISDDDRGISYFWREREHCSFVGTAS